jgi:4-hydroxy-tetrahydrodipicolinate reductase
MIDIAILGATGRMGKRLIALAREHDGRVSSALLRHDHKLLGQDAGRIAGVDSIDVPFSHELRSVPGVLLDFSAPDATRRWLDVCRQRHIPMLIGTTGLERSHLAAIEEASREIPILQASNMSLGIAVLSKLAQQAAQIMGGDIEIVEAHHRAKKDAPSGTAASLAQQLERSRGRDIPIHSLRMGDEVGRHTVLLALSGERLELTHVATNRDTFAHGALRAAKWLAAQKPGLYAISDMLGL